MREPRYCSTPCPTEAQTSTTPIAPIDWSIDWPPWPKNIGTSQIPISPPPRRPRVEKAPVMNPWKKPDTA